MEKATKLVVVETYGSISELGGINGPILNPAKIDIDLIVRMINNNKKVFEVNPKNYSERVRLTLKNARTVNFDNAKPAVVTTKPVTAKKTTSTAAPTTEAKKEEVKKSDDISKDGDFTKK